MNSTKQIIIGPLPPPVGGVSSATINLKRLLSEKNIDLRVFNTSSGKLREDLYGKKQLKDYFRFFTLIFQFIRFLIDNKSASICHLFLVSNAAFARDFCLLILLKLFRKKVLVHLHSKTKGELFLSPYLIRFFGLAVNCADKVLVLSDTHRNFFSKYIPSAKLVVLENFVFSLDHIPITQHNNRWLYVGRLSVMKGFFDLLEAVDICVNEKGLTNLRIDCLGLADTDENQDKIECYIRDKKLSEHVLIHGLITGMEKLNFFTQAKGLIFPSHFENSPVVLKEATCSFMPIILSDIQANKNVIERIGNGLFFPVKNIDEFVKKIMVLESNKSVFHSLKDNATNGFKHNDDYAFTILKGIFDEFRR